MTTPNHIVGGFVITGLFGSFMNLNILASPWYIGTTIIASILPDIDHPKSIVGKIFLPFSRFLNRRYGHRTITHSLLVLILSGLIVSYLEATFYHDTQISKTYFLAYMSHLILDMMTVQGVPLLYPFLRNPCVLPGNPEMRFRTGNLRTETMIFSFFLLSAVFLQPLIKNGFWTQYNRFFGTPKHLASEFRKSDDALLVKYVVKKGTEEIRGEGICIEAADSKIMLLEKNGFHLLDKTKYSIREVIPEHTGKSLRFEQISFMKISVDSLNQLVYNHPIQHIEIQTNNEIIIHHGQHLEQSKQFKAHYPEKLWFELIDQPTSKIEFTPYSNPRIKTLQHQIKLIRQQDNSATQQYEQFQDELTNLKSQYTSENDLAVKERLINRIKLLEKMDTPNASENKIKDLQLKIKELQLADQIKNQEKRTAIQQEYEESLSASTRITGFITKVIIADSPKATVPTIP